MFWSKLRSPEARRRRRRVVTLVAGGVLASAVVVATVTIVTLSRPAAQITSIDVRGSESLDPERLTTFLFDELAGRHFGLIPKTSSPLYPRAALTASLAEHFPRIQELSVRLTDPQTLRVNLTERTPAALWCGDIVPVGERPGHCYFMDGRGFIYARAPTFSGDPFERFYGPLTHGTPEGQQFVAPAEFVRLRAFWEELRARAVPIESVLIVDEENLELYHEAGPRLLVSRTDDLAEVAAAIPLVLANERLAGEALAEVAYIDLRFGNKVYLKDAAEPQEVGRSTPSTGQEAAER
ncbi:hypothetical protein GVX82_03800 [Patescibacteria group bacterium]|jgi:hypothetical protein|nr:hypothetical protein [Patescibacteria group bacterium]